MENFITSTSNTYVKHLKKLQTSAKYRAEKGTFVLEGQRPVADAVSYGIVPEAVLLSESYRGSVNAGKVYRISDKVARYISDTQNPQGIIAEFKMPKPDVSMLSAENSPLLFFSDGISDPGNLGTIIRTLEASGVSGLVLGQGTVDLYNPKTVRSTMAAIFNLPIYCSGDTSIVLKMLKNKGYKIVGTRMEDAVVYNEASFNEPTVVIMGNEARGISTAAADICDAFIRIPIEGKTESLNVGVAAAVIAYEAHRQRTK